MNTVEKSANQTNATTLRALDVLCMCIGDVAGGIGPYLGSYLRSTQHWDQGSIGTAISAMGIAGLIAQTPAGALIDRTRQKRFLIALAAILISISCISITIFHGFYFVVAAQIVYGISASILGPAIVAISLGLVGHKKFSARMGRNEACNHIGNVVAAVLTGLAGYYISGNWVFYLIGIFAALSIVAVGFINEKEIDHAMASGSRDEPADDSPVLSLGSSLLNRKVLMFAVAVALFHLSNAAMLPLAGQYISEGHAHEAALSISACIFAGQLVMIPASILAGKFADIWGRKPVFLVAFAALPIRGFLYTFSSDPTFIVAVQLLDGIGAGIFGVVLSVIVADLTSGSGHYNVIRGFALTAQGIGAALSNILAGYIVKYFGYNAGFCSLAAIGLVGLLVFYLGVPETKD
ncbi:MAG: MFS transporter [Cyanobacteria bacterium SZAS-4]|nr:MFS transporter [Cyanobacteria bacterium SZAS-4]